MFADNNGLSSHLPDEVYPELCRGTRRRLFEPVENFLFLKSGFRSGEPIFFRRRSYGYSYGGDGVLEERFKGGDYGLGVFQNVEETRALGENEGNRACLEIYSRESLLGGVKSGKNFLKSQFCRANGFVCINRVVGNGNLFWGVV